MPSISYISIIKGGGKVTVRTVRQIIKLVGKALEDTAGHRIIKKTLVVPFENLSTTFIYGTGGTIYTAFACG